MINVRTEVAVGQFADPANEGADLPTLEHVLDASRRKSGGREVVANLGDYGDAIGEVFQLRDDLRGAPAINVVVAHQLTDRTMRRESSESMSAPSLAASDVAAISTAGSA